MMTKEKQPQCPTIEVPLHNHMMGNYATMKGSDLDPFEDMEETHCKNIKLKSSQKN